MGRRSLSGGVRASGHSRIQFTFSFAGTRYRPTLPCVPTEANLRRARQHLIGIKTRIAAGTFSFAEEFPDYRRLRNVPLAGSPQTCGQVFDAYLAHCSARAARHDLAPVTLTSYQKVLDSTWRPELGRLRFLDIRYSQLVQIADSAVWSKRPTTTRSASCEEHSSSDTATTPSVTIRPGNFGVRVSDTRIGPPSIRSPWTRRRR